MPAMPLWILGCVVAIIPVAYGAALLTGNQTAQVVIVLAVFLPLLAVVHRLRRRRADKRFRQY